MSTNWYSRPVLFVADVDRAADFYAGKLGFELRWRYVEEDKAHVLQVERDGCELILSSQWPAKNGSAMLFISLDRKAFAELEAQIAANAVAAKEGHWGYRVLIVDDLDGNQLFFPFPEEKGEA